MHRFTAGIDLGSSTVKVVVLDGSSVVREIVANATERPAEAALRLLADVPPCPVVATGYGRDLLEVHHNFPTITEIKAHALGARHHVPGCATVIDVGGQDLKVICLDAAGKVARFEMNDRCAAGTGKFLEIMAQRLSYSLPDFGGAALNGSDTLVISAMCTVFAESEVVGLINRGMDRNAIARALHQSVVKRIAAMFKRTDPPAGKIVVTGGGALNPGLMGLLQDALGFPVEAATAPQTAGALGCAIHARQMPRERVAGGE
jgi:(R)-2-hydroxyacyl-CoA dehydratese activating ATPase